MLHDLWIGAAIGVLTALVRRMLRVAAPQVRYGVMLAALALLTLAPLVVAWKLSDVIVPSDNSRVATRRGIEPQALLQVEPSIELAAAAAERSSPAIVVALPTAAPLLDRIAGNLPAMWLVGAPLTFLLLATGLVGAERLRRSTGRRVSQQPNAQIGTLRILNDQRFLDFLNNRAPGDSSLSDSPNKMLTRRRNDGLPIFPDPTAERLESLEKCAELTTLVNEEDQLNMGW